MKKINFFIIIICTSFHIPLAKADNMCSTRLKLVIMNDNAQRPVAMSEKGFWASDKLTKINFDDSVYSGLVRHKLSKLERDSINNQFSIEVAVIFINNNLQDTFYTNSFFSDWRNSKYPATYTLKDDFLKRMFRSLYLGVYSDINKGIL